MSEQEYSHYELCDLIEQALQSAGLDEKADAYGIARQLMDEDAKPLTAAQQAVFDRDVRPHLVKLTKKEDLRRILDRNPD